MSRLLLKTMKIQLLGSVSILHQNSVNCSSQAAKMPNALRSRLIKGKGKGKIPPIHVTLSLGRSLTQAGITVDQFNDRMNWENYGVYWEYDHVLPISSFNLTEESEKKFCMCKS